MKKLFIMIAAAGFMYSCGGNTQKPKEQVEHAVSEVTKAVDMHNPKNSLDYKGTYTGKIPTAGGEGMLVTIELGENTYVRKTEYVNKKHQVFEEKGNFTWNADGNTIILDGITDSPNRYFVESNALVQLDMDGNRITGDLANMYVLTKK
jgi:uncharacterized lipoprotein NlpE involved in copper resistance